MMVGNDVFDKDDYVFNRDIPTIGEKIANKKHPPPPFWVTIPHHVISMVWSSVIEEWVFSRFCFVVSSRLIIMTRDGSLPITSHDLHLKHGEFIFSKQDVMDVFRIVLRRGSLYSLIITGDELPTKEIITDFIKNNHHPDESPMSVMIDDLLILNRFAMREFTEGRARFDVDGIPHLVEKE